MRAMVGRGPKPDRKMAIRRGGSGPVDLDAQRRRGDVLGPDVMALEVAQVAQRLVERVAELLLGDLARGTPGLAPDQGVHELVVVLVADGDPHLEPQRLPAALGQAARAGVALEALGDLGRGRIAQQRVDGDVLAHRGRDRTRSLDGQLNRDGRSHGDHEAGAGTAAGAAGAEEAAKGLGHDGSARRSATRFLAVACRAWPNIATTRRKSSPAGSGSGPTSARGRCPTTTPSTALRSPTSSRCCRTRAASRTSATSRCTPAATPSRTSTAARASGSCTRWAMTPSACPPRTTRSAPGSIRA